MADVNISKYRASVVREGSKPATPGFVVSEGQDPVDPAGSGQNHLPVTIAAAATGLAITDSQVLGGAGTVAQYIRGDGSLADFPESSGGGSSVSYYLNGSVAQGTIGGIAYKQLSKVPILGAGTNFTINADGYIASFITDAGDPNLLEIPGGNWNFETFFSANSGGGSPTFYVELYKVNAGGTATLIASSSSAPELIAFGTNLTPYFSSLAVPTTTLALTDRLAVRYYVTHSGRTITMHTEGPNLCQIITTFTTGLTALNGLTAQVQNFAVGTSGTDFAIASATATHTFNLPTASATNRGALSSADWSTFNSKQNALTNPVTGTGASGQVAYFTGTTAITSESNLFWDATNDRLGIATNTPATTLEVNGVGLFSGTSLIGNTKAGVYILDSRIISLNGSGARDLNIESQNLIISTGVSYGESMRVFSSRNLHIGPTPAADNGARLQVSGTGTFSDSLSVTGNIQLIAGGSGSSFDRQISLGSGTAYNYQVKANGDDFQLIEAGSHVFLEYDYGGSLGNGTIRLYNNTVSTASVTATSFIRTGGTSSQFLKADGSVDSTSYQPLLTNPVTGTGTSGTIPVFTGSTTIGNSIIQSNSTEVNIVGNGSALLFDSLGSSKDGGIQYVDDFQLRIFNSRGSTTSIILGSSNLDFNTSSSGNPKLRITQNGNVGINSPTTNNERLVVRQTTDNFSSVGFYTSASTGTSYGPLIQAGTNSSDASLRVLNQDGSLSYLIVRGNGNVGVGENNPTSSAGWTPKLVLNATSAALVVKGINGQENTFGSSNGLYIDSLGSSTGTNNKIIFRNSNSNSSFSAETRMVITSDGKVGIGEASPSSPLTINATVSSPQFRITRSEQTNQGFTITAGGGVTTFDSVDGTGTVFGRYVFNSTKGASTATRLTIDNSGIIVNGSVFVNTSGQSREISTYYESGSLGQNIWIGGGGLNSTTGGGSSALGSNNTSLGVFALEDNTTGYGNTAVGYLTLPNNTTGNLNTAVGQFSMNFNTTGYINAAFGTTSLTSNTTGYANSAFGCDALRYITTGRENTGIGFQAGAYINSGGNNSTSENSVYIGSDTRASANANTNEIVIGYGARGQGSNSAVLGNSSISKTVLRGKVLIGTEVDFGASLTLAGNIYMPQGTNREIFMGSATAYNYRIRSTGDDFIINEAGSVDRLRYSYSFTRWTMTGGLTVTGSLSKGSGSFKIDHPLPEKKDTHNLVHSFIEGPQADNIYRGKINLLNGYAEVNIDESAKMTEGTFVLLNGNVQCFTSNESGYIAINGKVDGNILKIQASDLKCNDTISWLVIGERIDQHMKDTDWTDKNGKVIVEPLKN
jgi:hypothetical protein